MNTAEKWINKLRNRDDSIEAIMLEQGDCYDVYAGSRKEVDEVIVRVWQNDELIYELTFNRRRNQSAESGIILVKNDSEFLITGFNGDRFYYFGSSDKRSEEALDASEAIVYLAGNGDENIIHGLSGVPVDYLTPLSVSGTGFLKKMVTRFIPETKQEDHSDV